MYPHLLRKAEKRFARAGLSQKPKPVYEPVPPPFVLADGEVGCVLSRDISPNRHAHAGSEPRIFSFVLFVLFFYLLGAGEGGPRPAQMRSFWCLFVVCLASTRRVSCVVVVVVVVVILFTHSVPGTIVVVVSSKKKPLITDDASTRALPSLGDHSISFFFPFFFSSSCTGHLPRRSSVGPRERLPSPRVLTVGS